MIRLLTGGVIFTTLAAMPAYGFHPDIYVPRVPAGQLADARLETDPSPVTSARIERGRAVYFGKGLCVTCHGSDGTGVSLPGHAARDFTDVRWQHARTDGELIWVLRHGSPGTGMPPRIGKVITEEEGWDVVHFIRRFGK